LSIASKSEFAEIQFGKLRPATPSKKPGAAIETAAVSASKKIERLKALRVARDLAEAEAKAALPAKKKRAKKAKAAPPAAAESSATLTGWWKDQREAGRNN
jgi:hypothetical protein